MSVHASALAVLSDWAAPDAGQDALRHAVLAFLLARPDGCARACVPGHVTASALVVSPDDEVLLTLHPRFGRWAQLGGHCEDTDTDIVAGIMPACRNFRASEAYAIPAGDALAPAATR